MHTLEPVNLRTRRTREPSNRSRSAVPRSREPKAWLPHLPGRWHEGEIRRYDYGTCHVCGEQMQRRRITQEVWVKGELVVVEDVPAGVWRQCGERVVTADVGRSLAALLENPQRRRTARRMYVPIIRYAAKVA